MTYFEDAVLLLLNIFDGTTRFKDFEECDDTKFVKLFGISWYEFKEYTNPDYKLKELTKQKLASIISEYHNKKFYNT